MILFQIACAVIGFSTFPFQFCLSFTTAPARISRVNIRGAIPTRPLTTQHLGAYHTRPTAPELFTLFSNSDDHEDVSSEKSDEDTLELTEEEKGIIKRVKGMFKGNKDDEKLTTRQRLAKMGLSALLSYGWVSNMSYSVSVSLAWYGFSKKTGLSPLSPGQWKPFLAVYAGFYVFNNFVRPIRFALAVGVTKYFDSAVNFIQERTKFSRSASIGLVVFLANFCGTLAAMSLGISLASAAAGVPIFPPKA